MARILVYNNDANRMETYYRGLSEAMPYNANRTLTAVSYTHLLVLYTLLVLLNFCCNNRYFPFLPLPFHPI